MNSPYIFIPRAHFYNSPFTGIAINEKKAKVFCNTLAMKQEISPAQISPKALINILNAAQVY